MDVATLGLATRYRDIEGANKALDKFSGAAKKAEKSAKGMGTGATSAARKTVAANDNIARSASRLGGVYRRVATIITGVFASAVAAVGLRQFISATIEADQVQAQLAAAIASTGGAAGRSISQLNEHAAALQKITNFGDEVINSAQGILLSFTRIRGDQFNDATEAVLNVATAMKMDLKSAALQVGKALNDPVQGMTALSRSGITFTEAQKEMVKQMVATGDMVGAQTLILKELETQFGGSAKAARDTLGGALKSLRNAWGDLFELGKSASEPLRLALEALIEAISDPAFVRFVQGIGAGMVGALALAVKGATLLTGGIEVLADHADILAVAASGAGTALIVAFGPAAVSAVASLATALRVGLVGALRAVAVAAAANPLGAFIVALVTAITAVWQFRDEVKSALAEVNAEIEQQLGINAAEHAKRGSNDMMNAFRAAFEVVSTTWRQLPGVVAGAAIGGVNAVNRWTSRMVQSAIDGINAVIEAVNSLPETFGFSGLSTIPDFGGLPQVPNPWAETVQTWMGEVNEIIDRNMSRDWFEETRTSASATTPVVEDLSTKVNELVGGLNEAAAAAAGAGTAGKSAADKIDDGLSGLIDRAGDVSEGVWQRMADEARLAAENTARFWRDTTGGFMRDLRSGLDQGKSMWSAFADAATRAIDRINDKLLDDLLDSIFKVNSAATSGGGRGGGLFSGILSGIGGLFGGGGGPSSSAVSAAIAGGGGLYAKGGAFSAGHEITAFANGGIVSRPTIFPMANGAGLMAERGPEAVMPLRRGPDGRLGVDAGGRGGGAPVINQNVSFDFRGANVSEEEFRRIARETTQEGNRELLRQIQKHRQLDGNFMGVA